MCLRNGAGVVHGSTVYGAEDAKQKLRFLLCKLKRPGAKRNKTKVQWTFVPLSGFARMANPGLASAAG
jgi:hypothetical protein